MSHENNLNIDDNGDLKDQEAFDLNDLDLNFDTINDDVDLNQDNGLSNNQDFTDIDTSGEQISTDNSGDLDFINTELNNDISENDENIFDNDLSNKNVLEIDTGNALETPDEEISTAQNGENDALANLDNEIDFNDDFNIDNEITFDNNLDFDSELDLESSENTGLTENTPPVENSSENESFISSTVSNEDIDQINNVNNNELINQNLDDLDLKTDLGLDDQLSLSDDASSGIDDTVDNDFHLDIMNDDGLPIDESEEEYGVDLKSGVETIDSFELILNQNKIDENDYFNTLESDNEVEKIIIPEKSKINLDEEQSNFLNEPESSSDSIDIDTSGIDQHLEGFNDELITDTEDTIVKENTDLDLNIDDNITFEDDLQLINDDMILEQENVDSGDAIETPLDLSDTAVQEEKIDGLEEDLDTIDQINMDDNVDQIEDEKISFEEDLSLITDEEIEAADSINTESSSDKNQEIQIDSIDSDFDNENMINETNEFTDQINDIEDKISFDDEMSLNTETEHTIDQQNIEEPADDFELNLDNLDLSIDDNKQDQQEETANITDDDLEVELMEEEIEDSKDNISLGEVNEVAPDKESADIETELTTEPADIETIEEELVQEESLPEIGNEDFDLDLNASITESSDDLEEITDFAPKSDLIIDTTLEENLSDLNDDFYLKHDDNIALPEQDHLGDGLTIESMKPDTMESNAVDSEINIDINNLDLNIDQVSDDLSLNLEDEPNIEAEILNDEDSGIPETNLDTKDDDFLKEDLQLNEDDLSLDTSEFMNNSDEMNLDENNLQFEEETPVSDSSLNESESFNEIPETVSSGENYPLEEFGGGVVGDDTESINLDGMTPVDEDLNIDEIKENTAEIKTEILDQKDNFDKMELDNTSISLEEAELSEIEDKIFPDENSIPELELELDENIDSDKLSGNEDILPDEFNSALPDDTSISETTDENTTEAINFAEENEDTIAIDLDNLEADLKQFQNNTPADSGITEEANADFSQEESTYSELKNEMKEKSSDTTLSTDVNTLKQNVTEVLKYLDQLLDALPEEKIKEFAKSKTFETYKKLFDELKIDN